MSFRFNTAAGFLAAASLLSGSAFAFAPEFNGDLPNVIITDKLKAPTTEFDRVSAGVGTEAIFRFTGAFNLLDYINLAGNNAADVKMLFTESTTGPGGVVNAPTTVQGQKILLINGQLASSTVPATTADFTSAPSITARSAQGQVDFYNTDFSGSDENNIVGPFDLVGDKTGHNLAVSPVQERVITIYIAGPSGAVDSESFYAFTTTQGDGDTLSTFSAADPFADVVASSSDFTGWVSFGLGLLAVIPASGNYNPIKAWTNTDNNTPIPSENPPYNALGATGTTGITFTPGTTPAASGTTSVTAAVGPNNFGLATWSRPTANIFAANKLYRLRARLASSNAASKDTVRIRLGNSTTVGQGQLVYAGISGQTGILNNNIGTTAADYYTYAVTKGTGTTNAGSLDFDVIAIPRSLVSADRGNELTVSQYELDVTDRSSLGTGAVLVNRGGTFTAASGEVGAPATGLTAFALGSGNDFSEFTINNQQPIDLTLGSAGASMNLVIGAQTAAPPVSGGQVWFSQVSGGGNIPVSEGKLYIADVYLSSTSAATGPFPTLRVGLSAGNQSGYGVYELDPAFPTAIGTSAKAYQAVLEPQFTVVETSGNATFNIGLIAADQSKIYNASKTIVIHRVVVTEYDDFK